MPAHGDERNRRQETTYGENITLVHNVTGETVYEGPMSSTTRTVFDKYCEVCGDWFEVKGILAVIFWDEEHRHADIAESAATN